MHLIYGSVWSYLGCLIVMQIIHLEQGRGALQVLLKSANAARSDHELAET